MSALALPHEDNVAYAGPTRGTADELRAHVHGNASHWRGSNSAGTLAAPTSFEVLPVAATVTAAPLGPPALVRIWPGGSVKVVGGMLKIGSVGEAVL